MDDTQIIDDWDEVSAQQDWEYKVPCDKCGHVITIVQEGRPISEDLFDFILNEVHILQCYDSLWKYSQEHNVQLNLEMKNNVPCG